MCANTFSLAALAAAKFCCLTFHQCEGEQILTEFKFLVNSFFKFRSVQSPKSTTLDNRKHSLPRSSNLDQKKKTLFITRLFSTFIEWK